MTKIRLNKYLSESGICSRRQADELISSGKVSVNGVSVPLGTKIDPDIDEIIYGGKKVKQEENLVYYALYKPKDVISTASDEMGRKTVTDLVPDSPKVVPVGRLDKNSEGLIVLTNDGALTQELTHPSFKHEKEYKVVVRSSKTGDRIKSIEKTFISGIKIDNKIMKADRIEIAEQRTSVYDIRITIHTGYNRQIRKMCAKMGLEVLKLKRIRIGKLKLEDLNLKPGEYKEIKKERF